VYQSRRSPSRYLEAACQAKYRWRCVNNKGYPAGTFVAQKIEISLVHGKRRMGSAGFGADIERVGRQGARRIGKNQVEGMLVIAMEDDFALDWKQGDTIPLNEF
jgi:hypothetical protein